MGKIIRQKLNKKEKEENREVIVKYSPSKVITKDEQRSFNGGYLFLQKIYHELGYKERWIKENGHEQKLIVTHSIKYRDYIGRIRSTQVECVQKAMDNNPDKISKSSQNDYKRFIEKNSLHFRQRSS